MYSFCLVSLFTSPNTAPSWRNGGYHGRSTQAAQETYKSCTTNSLSLHNGYTDDSPREAHRSIGAKTILLAIWPKDSRFSITNPQIHEFDSQVLELSFKAHPIKTFNRPREKNP